MREFITISLGPNSNFTNTHFWNFQDELLKQSEATPNPVLYYETKKTNQLVPRTVYVDFRNNFGNFLTCFSQEKQSDKIDERDIQSLWHGNIKKNEQDRIQQSIFQRELNDQDDYDDGYDDRYGEQEEEIKGSQDIYANSRNLNGDSDDEEDEGYGGRNRGGNNKKMQGLMNEFKGNSQNMFMQMMMQEKEKQEKLEQIDTSTKNQPKKKEEKPEKTLQEYYNDFNFENDVKYFTDFMQSRMQNSNQLILPNTFVNEDNYQLYHQGKLLAQTEKYFMDDTEDRIRNQLEESDRMQGFQIICDTNSGHGSFAEIMINEYLKDEAPKVPILLYSIKNSNVFAEDENQIKQNLEILNDSFWLAELSIHANLVIPLEQPVLEEAMKNKYMQRYDNENMFHKTSLYSLIVDNLAYSCYKSGGMDFKDLIPQLIYSEKPNIITVQSQVPYLHQIDQNFLENLNKDTFSLQENYIRYNSVLQQSKRPSIRQNYIIRGINSLVDINRYSIPQVKDEFERFLFKNMECQRGIVSTLIPNNQLLPIPYPRYLSQKIFTEDGLLKSGSLDRDDFVSTIPHMIKISYDSQYLGNVKMALDRIRIMKASIRVQMGRDYLIEEDELREIRERLEGLYENLRALDAIDPDYGDEDDEDDDDDDNQEHEDY